MVSSPIQESAPYWLPIDLEIIEGALRIHWFNARNADFKMPFLNDTLRKIEAQAKVSGQIARQVTSEDKLFELADISPQVCQLDGLIFHISRCGSTLTSQILAHGKKCVVLSEPVFFDSIMRKLASTHVKKSRQKLLQAFLKLWQQFFSAEYRHLYIKLDAWLLHSANDILACFPNLKCYFIYRDLSQVIASHVRQRGAFLIPQFVPSHYFSLPFPGTEFMSPDGYTLDIIAGLYKIGMKLVKSKQFIPLNYREIPDKVFDTVLPYQTDKLKHHQLLRRHAKNTKFTFTNDADKVQILTTTQLKKIQQRQSDIDKGIGEVTL